MYVIIGANGKVGYATAAALQHAGKSVRAIVRNEQNAICLHDIDCEVVQADIGDVEALARAMRGAESVQIIIPPSPEAKDGAQNMRINIENLALALEKAKPETILVISDYGAHVTKDIGMPSMCRTFEERISHLDGHKIILRSAEHMENWARVIPLALATGVLSTFHEPTDMEHPTISAPDLGLLSAELLMRSQGGDKIEVIHAEGPRRYSALDVAAVLTELSGRSIRAEVVPRSQWEEILTKGMSLSLAELLIKANNAQNAGGLVDIEPNASDIQYGKTELMDALRPHVS